MLKQIYLLQIEILKKEIIKKKLNKMFRCICATSISSAFHL